MSDPDSNSFCPKFRPTADWSTLQLRAKLLRQMRTFFDENGFLEVETPILSADTVVDRHLDPFEVLLPDGRTAWLQTSPEFAMKRLLAAGVEEAGIEAIYQITHVFRQEESGPLHNPEFTMVEWYRIGDGLVEGIDLLDRLSQVTLGRGPAERLTYRDAFLRHVGLDPLTVGTDRLIGAVESNQIVWPESLSAGDRDTWLDLLLVELVQPHLGTERPAILYDYPASQSALARVRPDDPPVAERFEWYVDGVELANGYHELTDPEVLRKRNAETNRLRAEDGKPKLPETSRLLEAMDAGLPASAGVALGFDRLVMLLAGFDSIDQVIPFPFSRA